MATLNLTRTWITRVDTGETVNAATTGRSQQWALPAGEVRAYAGGRQRFVGTTGEQGEIGLTLRLLPPSTVATLRGWKGLTVLVRDHRGQRLFGVFTAVNVIEFKRPDLYDVALTVRAVTHTEAV